MSLPDFYIIGAPKCGTTTLYDWLANHPQVHAPRKEPCFFSQDIYPTASLPTHISSLEEYKEIFALTTPSQRISGEATPKYLYSDMALSELKRLRPDAKIIICLRDPVDLVISFHNQKFREGAESEKDFAKAWRRTVDVSAQTTCRAPTVGGYINYFFWGAFGERLRRLFDIFPTEQILIITLDEIQSDSTTVYARILKFLGINHDGREDFSASNIGYRISGPYLHRAAIRLKRYSAPFLQHIYNLRGGRGLGMMKLLNRYNTAPGKYACNVPREVRREIRHIFADDLKIAERFLQGRVLVRHDDFDHF